MNVTKRNEIVEKNLPLVASRVRKLNNGFFDEDLFQEGVMGLIHATDRFDSNKGFAFSTYATKYVDGYIKTYRNKNAVIRPIREGNSFSRASVDSLSSPVSIENQEYSLEDILHDDKNPIKDVIESIAIDMFLGTLNQLERSIVDLVMDGCTQREVSQVVSISQPHVHRILKKVRTSYSALQY